MRAGLLNEIVTVLRPYVERNEYGSQAVPVWREVASTRASVKFLSGNRSSENSEVFLTEETDFAVRTYVDVAPKDRIVWKGRKYRILSIDDDRSKQSKTIRAELVNE